MNRHRLVTQNIVIDKMLKKYFCPSFIVLHPKPGHGPLDRQTQPDHVMDQAWARNFDPEPNKPNPYENCTKKTEPDPIQPDLIM